MAFKTLRPHIGSRPALSLAGGRLRIRCGPSPVPGCVRGLGISAGALLNGRARCRESVLSGAVQLPPRDPRRDGAAVMRAAGGRSGWDPSMNPDGLEDTNPVVSISYDNGDFDPNYNTWTRRARRTGRSRFRGGVGGGGGYDWNALPAPLRFLLRVFQIPVVARLLRVAFMGMASFAAVVVLGTLVSTSQPPPYYLEPHKGNTTATYVGATERDTARRAVTVGQLPDRPGVLADVVSAGEEMKGTLEVARARLPPDMSAGMLLLDLDHGAYVAVNSDEVFSAASMIKFPVLVAFLQEVDRGHIELNEEVVMREDLVAGESGGLQYEKPGTRFEALELAYQMIAVSDNTATNMLIDRCGGMAEVNERFREWGLTDTVIRGPLPDLEGTNSTTPKDMVYLLSLVESGQLLSMKSRDRMFEVMHSTLNDTMLPAAVPSVAKVFHKTGDIGFAVGDVGMVAMPKGGRFAVSVIVRRPFNDQRAVDYIRDVCRQFYADVAALQK